jgi:hypothetical protein
MLNAALDQWNRRVMARYRLYWTVVWFIFSVDRADVRSVRHFWVRGYNFFCAAWSTFPGGWKLILKDPIHIEMKYRYVNTYCLFRLVVYELSYILMDGLTCKCFRNVKHPVLKATCIPKYWRRSIDRITPSVSFRQRTVTTITICLKYVFCIRMKCV